MRYLGSKAKLLSTIESIIEKYDIDGETFGDLQGLAALEIILKIGIRFKLTTFYISPMS